MSLSAEEDEIVDHLQEIARLRRALINIKGMCESEAQDKEKIILDFVKEVMGIE